jgi:hypothetical protein
MSSSGKGLAVVEAVVLLLGAMTAGGAMGEANLDSSFNGLQDQLESGNATAGVNYVSEASSELENTIATDIMVMSMWENRETGELTLVVQNIGQKTVNTSDFTLIPLNRRLSDGNCFKPGNSTILEPEGIYRCNTGIEFPKVYEEAKFKVVLDGTSKNWEFTCHPRTSDTIFC